jgi:hypothetical protein
LIEHEKAALANAAFFTSKDIAGGHLVVSAKTD